MAAIASVSVARENGQCKQTRRPRKPIYTRFQGNYLKKKLSRKKNCCQVAAILIIVGKLKIQSGDLHTHG